MGARLRFQVLGELEVCRDGTRLHLPRGRRRAVLAALLVHAGRPVSADALTHAAWGDDAPHDPDGALRTVVSRLRGLLGAGTILMTPGGYRLDLHPEALDAHRFETLCREAHGKPAPEAAHLLDEALALWRGMAYGEFVDHDFARAESVRLEQLRRSATEKRASLAVDLGEPQDAVAELESLLVEDPLREHAVTLLAEALYRAGRPADALERLREHRVLLADELGLDPSPALAQLEGRVLRHDLPAPPQDRGPPGRVGRHETALPARPGLFVGREEELTWLTQALDAFRLLCVTGPGGVGKTRLVSEVLTSTSNRRGAPVVVARLSEVAAGEVCSAVASAVGLDPSWEPVAEQVAEALSASASVVLLDGCEHVLDDVRPLVLAVNRLAPRVRVVATSRVRLGLAQEQVLPLEPLGVPAQDKSEPPWQEPDGGGGDRRAELSDARSPAVALFLNRLRRVRPRLAITPGRIREAAQICRLVDGLPLAIELAATTAGSLGLAPTLDRLAASLDVLDRTNQDNDHPSLRAVIDGSYRLLDEPDQALLAALSVFGGSFDLDAVERVDPAADNGRVAHRLSRLVEASLVTVDLGTGPARYRLLGMVRAFAQERLAEAGAAEAVQRAAAVWAADLAVECGHLVSGPDGADAMHRLDRNQTILVDGTRWALATGEVDLAARTVGALTLCTHWRPGAVLLEVVEEVASHPLAEHTPDGSLVLAGAGLIKAERGQLDTAVVLGNRARALARRPEEHAVALVALAVAHVYGGDLDRARQLWAEVAALEEAPAAYRVDGHGTLALLTTLTGDMAMARKHVQAALEYAQSSGSAAATAYARYAAGEALLVDDRTAAIPVLRAAAEAADRVGAAQVGLISRIALLSALTREAQHQGALQLAASLVEQQRLDGWWSALWTTLRIVAELLSALGDPEPAALLLIAAEEAPTAPIPFGRDVERYRSLHEDLRRALGEERLSLITGLARSLPRAEVCDRAVEALERGQVPR